jgi:hypothetical protein
VAGALSSSSDHHPTGRSSAAGIGTRRMDLRRYTIPIVSLAEQQIHGQVIRQLAEYQATLDVTAALGTAIAQEIRAGLTSGALVLDQPSA